MAWNGLISAALLLIPMAAFAIVIAYTVVAPAAHLLVAALRLLTGGRAELDWWLLGRILPLLILITALVPLAYLSRAWSPGDQFAFGQFAIMFVAIAALMVPIAVPLVKAYQAGRGNWGLYGFSILAFLAMPVAAALTTGSIFEITARAAQESEATRASFANLPNVFQIQPELSPCTVEIVKYSGNSLAAERPTEVLPSLLDTRIYFFWVDMTMKAAFLDFFEAFDCGTTNLRHNPANPMMSAFVFLYRAFVQLFVLAVIALPFTGRTKAA
jgi:hypothetical protein